MSVPTTAFVISFRAIGSYVTDRGEPISMRAVIQRLQSLPATISLEAEAEGTVGEVPLRVTVHVQASNGLVLNTNMSVFPNGQDGGISIINTGASASDNLYVEQHPGNHLLKLKRTGVTNTGYTELTKTFAISARPKASPPVGQHEPDERNPIPAGRPSISVLANGDGSFVVSGANFLPGATVHIRVVDAALTTVWFDQTSSPQGTLQYPTGKICQRPGQLSFSANDGRCDQQDHTGTLWSNTATTTCPP